MGKRSILDSGLPSLLVSSIWTCKFAYLVLSRISFEIVEELVNDCGVSSAIDMSLSDRMGVAAMVGSSFIFFHCSATEFRRVFAIYLAF